MKEVVKAAAHSSLQCNAGHGDDGRPSSISPRLTHPPHNAPARIARDEGLAGGAQGHALDARLATLAVWAEARGNEQHAQNNH